MQGTPSVKRLVMFKHGVAYIERGGPASGPFELSFKKDEMNDVLKSLAVWVAKGEARVGAVAFEKPEDPQVELERRKLNLPGWGTMLALLGVLKGRKVRVSTGGAAREGEVVGVEAESIGERGERRRLVLREEDAKVSLVDFSTIESFELAEAPSRADLAFFVDRSRAASSGENRTVKIDVSGNADDLRVSYVVPAPTWRVSYRIAKSKEDTMVMGWGIVHNPVDEDLESLDLVLTTGQPVSFVIDLYNPKSVHRAVVEEESRAVAGPTRYERAPLPAGGRGMPPPPSRVAAPGAPPMAHAAMRRSSMAMPMQSAAEEEEAPDTGRTFGTAGESMAGAASYEDRGELFEYRVGAKIGLKRGGSAMVPLFASKAESNKERIWRLGSPPSPDLVITFKNTTGAVLEEGPAVIYDDDVYAGEAMLPYSARGSEVKLAFAKDLGVRCRYAGTQERVATGVGLSRTDMIEELREEMHQEISAESDYDEEVEVIIELPKFHSRNIAPGSFQPFEETSSFRRFKLKVPPRGKAVEKVVEYWVVSQRYQYGSIQMSALYNWTKKGLLDPQVATRLGEVLKLWADATQHDQERKRQEAQRNDAYQKQTKISEQLQVLKESGPEGALRLRYVKELEAEQDRVNAAERKIDELVGAAQRARDAAAEKLAQLTAK
jgi:hypothetical protein